VRVRKLGLDEIGNERVLEDEVAPYEETAVFRV
jgi:hypothetical protein